MSDQVESDVLGQSLLSVSARGSLLKSKTSQRQAAVSKTGGQALPVVSPSQWLRKFRVLGVLAPPWSTSSVFGNLETAQRLCWLIWTGPGAGELISLACGSLYRAKEFPLVHRLMCLSSILLFSEIPSADLLENSFCFSSHVRRE